MPTTHLEEAGERLDDNRKAVKKMFKAYAELAADSGLLADSVTQYPSLTANPNPNAK